MKIEAEYWFRTCNKLLVYDRHHQQSDLWNSKRARIQGRRRTCLRRCRIQALNSVHMLSLIAPTDRLERDVETNPAAKGWPHGMVGTDWCSSKTERNIVVKYYIDYIWVCKNVSMWVYIILSASFPRYFCCTSSLAYSVHVFAIPKCPCFLS